MKSVIVFTIILLALFHVVPIAQSQNVDYNDAYLNAPNTNYQQIQNYFRTLHPDFQPGSRSLGSNIAGYDLGRYALHSLMWYHKTWERTPEYQTATDDEKLLFLGQLRNKIDTMTTEPYFRDVSLCANESFKGSTHDAIDKFADGYSGWGFRRAYDINTALPGALNRIENNQWYKFRIRVVNIGTEPLTRVSVWLALSGQSFPVLPYYEQTYRGRMLDGNEIERNANDAGNRIWFPHGTVALLSSFSNTKFTDISVFLGTGSTRIPFYSLNQRGPDYLSNGDRFHSEWRKIGWSDAANSDTTVWSFSQENGQYIISCNAASTYPGLVPIDRRTTVNSGVNAAAILKYNDESLNSSYQIQDCEVEFEMMIEERTTAYAEAGIGVRWNNRLGVMPLSFTGGPEDDGNDWEISQTVDGEVAQWPGMFQSTHTSAPVNVPYFRHNYKYIGTILRPDAINVYFQTPNDYFGHFFGAAPVVG